MISSIGAGQLPPFSQVSQTQINNIDQSVNISIDNSVNINQTQIFSGQGSFPMGSIQSIEGNFGLFSTNEESLNKIGQLIEDLIKLLTLKQVLDELFQAFEQSTTYDKSGETENTEMFGVGSEDGSFLLYKGNNEFLVGDAEGVSEAVLEDGQLRRVGEVGGAQSSGGAAGGATGGATGGAAGGASGGGGGGA